MELQFIHPYRMITLHELEDKYPELAHTFTDDLPFTHKQCQYLL